LRRPWSGAVAAGLVALAVILASSLLKATIYDNYVLLADALRHGHTWIDFPGDYIDAFLYNGKRYIIEGPTPAVLLVPFAFAFGKHLNQTLLASVLGAIAVGAGWELCRRLGADLAARVWLTLFLFAGTDLWWTAALGDVWFVAHTSAVCFTLLALVELAGKRRAWLVALFGVAAAESRFPLVLAFPVYAYLVALGDLRSPRFLPSSLGDAGRRLASSAFVLVPAAILWVAYNEARWGQPFDIGYAAWYARPEVGGFFGGGSEFQLRFLPGQLYAFFVQPPGFHAVYPWLSAEIWGIALPWTSPALVLALFARRPAPLVVALWVATILVAAPSFFYYAIGFSQFGMRHALDFEPFLFALMVLAVGRRMPLSGAALCGYSALVGAWGLWYWQTFQR
jgi:hypothetical protein